MKSFALFLVLIAASVAFGQATTSPLGPTRESRPLPTAQANRRDRVVIHRAQVNRVRGDEIDAQGDVLITANGYDLYADRIFGNMREKTYTLDGHARVVGADEEVSADTVFVNLIDETFEYIQGTARVGPSLTQGRTTDDLFISGREGGGSRHHIVSRDGAFTTCDLPTPHYHFDADMSDVKPGKRAILRDVRLRIANRTIFGLPYLVVPLDDRAERFFPEAGHSPDEGYFVKTRYSIPIHGEDYLDTRVDYYTKLGAGLGADYYYENPRLKGVLKAYALTGGRRSFTLSSEHEQAVGSSRLTVDSNFQRNNYLTAPEATTWSSRAQLAWGSGANSTRVGYTMVSNDSSGFASTSQSLSLSDSRSPWRNGLTELDLNLNRSKTSSSFGGGTDSQILDVRFNALHDLRSFQAELLYQRAIPVDGVEGFQSSSDRTPLVSVTTDGRRLLGAKAGSRWPFRAALSVGEFNDYLSENALTRVAFDTDLRRNEVFGKSQIRWGWDFRQRSYSDDTALFTLSSDVAYSYQFAPRSSANLNYRYLRSQGFSPLSLDRTGRTDAFNFDVRYEPTARLRFSAQTGYDLMQIERDLTPWQQVWLRSEWLASRDLRIRTSSIYDTYSNVWSNNRIDLDGKLFGARFSAGARYDGRRSTWSALNLLVDGLKIGKFTFGTLLDFNGYTQRLEAQQYNIAYDLHCAEAVLEILDQQAGFRSGLQIAFFIRLKALPFRSPFGIGTRGQSIGTNSGYGY